MLIRIFFHWIIFTDITFFTATDPDSDIRTEAYERLQKPSQMLSARYVAQITADFSDDIGKPIKIIQAMTDRAALEYVAGNAALEYFQDLAKERLARIKH